MFFSIHAPLCPQFVFGAFRSEEDEQTRSPTFPMRRLSIASPRKRDNRLSPRLCTTTFFDFIYSLVVLVAFNLSGIDYIKLSWSVTKSSAI